MRRFGTAVIVVAAVLGAAAIAKEGSALMDAAAWTGQGTEEVLTRLAHDIEALDPKDSRTLARSGHVLLRAGKTEEAAEVFERALRSDPKDDEAWNMIGKAYAEMGMWERADQWFQKAVDRDPKDNDHKVEWGVCLWNRGDKEQAARLFSEALRDAPKSARIYYKIGRGLE